MALEPVTAPARVLLKGLYAPHAGPNATGLWPFGFPPHVHRRVTRGQLSSRFLGPFVGRYVLTGMGKAAKPLLGIDNPAIPEGWPRVERHNKDDKTPL